MTVCRFNGHTNPRLLIGRHLEPSDDPEAPRCPDPEHCRGCYPCPDNHCAVCGVEHTTDSHPHTCPECVAGIRDDLKALPALCLQLRRHARQGNSLRLAAAPIPGGEATVMLGPAVTAHSRAYYEDQGHKPKCTDPTCRGCLVDASHKADEWDGDADTPMLVLVGWEDAWRDTLGSPTQKRPRLKDALEYLADHLTLMAQRHDPPIDAFAEEVASLRYHLEEVLGDGVRDQPGAPCVHCGTALVQISSKPRACKHRRLADEIAKLTEEPRFNLHALCWAYPNIAKAHQACDQGGLRDTWQCLRCRRRYTDDQYRHAVGTEYIRSARSLTARELEWKTGVPASTIRAWGSMKRVDKKGRNEFGLWRYDVAQVEAKVPEYKAQVAAAAKRAEEREAASKKAKGRRGNTQRQTRKAG